MWKVSPPQIKTLSHLTPYIPALIGRGFTAKLLSFKNRILFFLTATTYKVREIKKA